MSLVRFSNKRTPSVFDDFMNNWNNENWSTQSSLPKVNIAENEDAFHVELAAPGKSKEDFKLTLDNEVLTIASENKAEKTDADKNYSRREFHFSSFRRSFTLPEAADGEQIKANYNHGILSVEIPKREEAKPKPTREIEIA